MKRIFLFLAPMLAGVMWLGGCSTTSQTTRIATPLQPISSPFSLQLNWQLVAQKMSSADGRGLAIAEDDERIYMGAASGLLSAFWKQNKSRNVDQVAWQSLLEPRIVAGPVVVGEQLIIGTSKGDVLALSPQDGHVFWQARLNSEVVSQPVVRLGRVFVRTNDGRVVALNANNGEIVWVAEHQMPSLFLRGAAPVLVDDDLVYVGRESGFVEALSFATGEKVWEARVAIPSGRTDLERMVDIQAGLLLDSGRLFALSYNGRMVALNAQNGNFLWVKDISGYRDFVLFDQVLYVVDSDDVIRAIDPNTGIEYWTQAELKFRQLGDLALDTVVMDRPQLRVTDSWGYIHWLDAKDGGLTGRFKHANHLDMGRHILQLHQDGTHYYVLDSEGTMSAYVLR
ncbi:MAG: outer membrane protein assembly factor BamB [Thiomicrospira sp.]|jgi:outer membrane protein assembly factor BamB|nr:outer membrane protein assembly factor BamB [Thiomicrospira sp.]